MSKPLYVLKELELPNNWDARLVDINSYRFETIPPRVKSAVFTYQARCTIPGYDYIGGIWDVDPADLNQAFIGGDEEKWKNYCRSSFADALTEKLTGQTVNR